LQRFYSHTSSSTPRAWDGSTVEVAQIERLKRACRRIDCYWDVECGCSDENDPWCAIYDWRRDRPVLHVARIDGRYLVVFPLCARTLLVATLRSAIDAALAELTNLDGLNARCTRDVGLRWITDHERKATPTGMLPLE
jgi:hypothetical protein